VNAERLARYREDDAPFDRVEILGRLRIVERGEKTALERELLARCEQLQEERDRLAELLRYGPHQRDGNFVDFTFHVDTLSAALSSLSEQEGTT
jgi:hypothetical protein